MRRALLQPGVLDHFGACPVSPPCARVWRCSSPCLVQGCAPFPAPLLCRVLSCRALGVGSHSPVLRALPARSGPEDHRDEGAHGGAELWGTGGARPVQNASAGSASDDPAAICPGGRARGSPAPHAMELPWAHCSPCLSLPRPGHCYQHCATSTAQRCSPELWGQPCLGTDWPVPPTDQADSEQQKHPCV